MSIRPPGPHWKTTTFSSTIDAGLHHQAVGTAAHIAAINADRTGMGLGALLAANHYQKALEYCRRLKRQMGNLKRCLIKKCSGKDVATQYAPIKEVVGPVEGKCKVLMQGGPPGP